MTEGGKEAVRVDDAVVGKASGPEFGEGGNRDDNVPLGSDLGACGIHALTCRPRGWVARLREISDCGLGPA